MELTPHMNEDLQAVVEGLQGIKDGLNCTLEDALAVYELYLEEQAGGVTREHIDLERDALDQRTKETALFARLADRASDADDLDEKQEQAPQKIQRKARKGG